MGWNRAVTLRRSYYWAGRDIELDALQNYFIFVKWLILERTLIQCLLSAGIQPSTKGNFWGCWFSEETNSTDRPAGSCSWFRNSYQLLSKMYWGVSILFSPEKNEHYQINITETLRILIIYMIIPPGLSEAEGRDRETTCSSHSAQHFFRFNGK